MPGGTPLAAEMSTPKISVVIPTRNRPQFLLDSVNVALAHCVNVEVVVCDNSDTDALRERLAEQVAGGRVIYDHGAELRSVVQNFERAANLASGDWLIFIGDDDSIGPGLEDVAKWATRAGVEAVVSYSDTFVALYYWPGVKSKYYGDAYAARLFVWPFTGEARQIDGMVELRRVARRFGGNLGALPRAYHGLVSRALFDRVRQQHGHVFGGVSPDIYSAALIAAHSRKSALVNYPFVIPGGSSPSTAGQGAARTDVLSLRQTDHIARFGSAFAWDARIPEFYAPQTVWAFSLLKALEQLPELRIRPAYGRLYARCLLYCHRYSKITWRTAFSRASGGSKLGMLFALAAGAIGEMAELSKRVARRIASPGPMGNARRFNDLATISQAYASLVAYIEKSGSHLKLPTSGIEPQRGPSPICNED